VISLHPTHPARAAGLSAFNRISCSLLAAGLLVGAGALAHGRLHKAEHGNHGDVPPSLLPQGALAGEQAVRDAQATTPARLQERAALLRTGEAALARRDTALALDAFDRASLILHAADTEIALVRGYMQAGDYRRALSFGAHTAGAHLDVAGGSLLYAWLLHLGGQTAVAQKVLADLGVRGSGDSLMLAVQQQLRSGAPLAAGPLLALPLRLAPYAEAKGLPKAARIAGSAVLLPAGNRALVPLRLLGRASGKLWLRNGLGQLARARIEQRLPALDLALVRLERPLPVADEGLALAASDAFPGSAGFAVEFVSSAGAAGAWPVLRSGFLGGWQGTQGDRLLGIDMPAGPRGGPVFDAAGQLLGVALPASARQTGDRLVSVSQLRQALGAVLPAARPVAAPGTPKPHGAADKLYEASLRTTLQVLTAP